MRKLIYVSLLVLPVFVFGQSWGVDSTGTVADFEFILPSIVAINVSNSTIQWNFSDPTLNANNPAFPPAAFPEYYEPTSPNARPYQTIDYLVLFAGVTVDWELRVVGDGDPAPACGIALDEIEYAANPPVAWTPFSTTAAAVASGSGVTGGWQSLDQNYRVEINGDETNTAYSTCQITYTIQTL
jgi:hypothetical protein